MGSHDVTARDYFGTTMSEGVVPGPERLRMAFWMASWRARAAVWASSIPGPAQRPIW